METSLGKRTLRAAGIGAFFRPRDVQPLGVSFRQLQQFVADGAVEKAGSGLYRLVAIEPTELETIAMVASAVPNAIVCLLTALTIHRIGTQLPHEVWIALDRKARKPRTGDLPVRIVRFSGTMLRYGIEERQAQGVAFRITSPARTVVDCFRYRNKIGIDVALEALKDSLQTRRVSVSALVRTAEVCRVQGVLRPYLEALLA